MRITYQNETYDFLRFDLFLQDYKGLTERQYRLSEQTLIEDVLKAMSELYEGEAGFYYVVPQEKGRLNVDIDYYFVVAPNEDGIHIVTYVEARSPRNLE